MHQVRAKFTCTEVTQYAGGSKKVVLQPVTPPPNASEEDKAFWKYTPSGNLTMTIDNPPASSLFNAGGRYYIDFTAVEDSPDLA